MNKNGIARVLIVSWLSACEVHRETIPRQNWIMLFQNSRLPSSPNTLNIGETDNIFKPKKYVQRFTG